MRDQVFSYFGVNESFKDLVTAGPAFQFGMRDIAKVRMELKALIKSLTVLYSEFKKEEKAQKAEAKRRAHEASKVTAQDEGVKPDEKENSPLQNGEVANDVDDDGDDDEGETAL
jgi:hypothetical protein